jgi:hypothetical protein
MSRVVCPPDGLIFLNNVNWRSYGMFSRALDERPVLAACRNLLQPLAYPDVSPLSLAWLSFTMKYSLAGSFRLVCPNSRGFCEHHS